jgi:hypothetical protein
LRFAYFHRKPEEDAAKAGGLLKKAGGLLSKSRRAFENRQTVTNLRKFFINNIIHN